MGRSPESRQPAPPPRGALGSTARAQSRKAPRQEKPTSVEAASGDYSAWQYPRSGDREGPFVALMSFCSDAFLTEAPPRGSAQTLKSVA